VWLKVRIGGNYLSEYLARVGATCWIGDLLDLVELKTGHRTAELRCSSTWKACTQTGCRVNMPMLLLLLLLMLNGVSCLFPRNI